jgi:predicted Zn-dependent peptidase
MGFAEMFATYEWFSDYLNKLAKVTPPDVQRVAREYFRPRNRIVGTYIPKGPEG